MWQLEVIKILWIALLLAVLSCLWGPREIYLNKSDTKMTKLLGYFLMMSGLMGAYVISACLIALQENFSSGTFIDEPN